MLWTSKALFGQWVQANLIKFPKCGRLARLGARATPDTYVQNGSQGNGVMILRLDHGLVTAGLLQAVCTAYCD